MAGLFETGGLLGPVVPGMSGAINPLAMLGFGLAAGNPLGAIQQMAQMQQAHARLAQEQQYREAVLEQQRREFEAEQVAAQHQAAGQLAQQNALRALMQSRGMAPEAIEAGVQFPELAMKRLMPEPTQPTSLQRNLRWLLSQPEGSPQRELGMQILTTPQTVVDLGPGSIPTGMRRVETPEGETRLEVEPGGPEDVKRQLALSSLEGLYSDINEMDIIVREHGTEVPITEQGRRLTNLRSRLLGNINKLRDMGVIDEAEAKRLEEEFARAATWQPWKTGQMVLPGITAFKEEIGRKLEATRRAYGVEPSRAEAPETPPAATQGGWSFERID